MKKETKEMFWITFGLNAAAFALMMAGLVEVVILLLLAAILEPLCGLLMLLVPDKRPMGAGILLGFIVSLLIGGAVCTQYPLRMH